jgi:hypothetical protein
VTGDHDEEIECPSGYFFPSYFNVI